MAGLVSNVARVDDMVRTSPSYQGLKPASERASTTARAIRGRDTKPEMLLRKALWRMGLRYRVACRELPGAPDVVFPCHRLAVFCDGDFWHGRDWETRRGRLAAGSNPDYWVAKISRNMERDRENTLRLEAAGWAVIRLWESDIVKNPQAAAAIVCGTIRGEFITSEASRDQA